jgi:hypothetical protein
MNKKFKDNSFDKLVSISNVYCSFLMIKAVKCSFEEAKGLLYFL